MVGRRVHKLGAAQAVVGTGGRLNESSDSEAQICGRTLGGDDGSIDSE